MSVGFPEGSPLRRAATFAYNHFSPVQFLRTTYKAGPLVALGLACLGGGAAATLWTWVRESRAGAAARRRGARSRSRASPCWRSPPGR